LIFSCFSRSLCFGASVCGCYCLAGRISRDEVLVTEFFYRTGLGLNLFLLAALLALVISVLTVSYQAIKTAVANPIESLRYE